MRILKTSSSTSSTPNTSSTNRTSNTSSILSQDLKCNPNHNNYNTPNPSNK